MFNKMGMHACLPGMSFATFLRTNVDTTKTVNKNKPLNHAPGSVGICNCDRKNDTHCGPLRTGGASVLRSGSNIRNAFFQRQLTVPLKTDDLPMFPLFSGLNATFGK